MTTQTETEDRTQCACSPDCPAQTGNTFAPGHDARMVSRLSKEVIAGDLTLDAALEEAEDRGGSEHLQERIIQIVNKHLEREKRKADARKLATSAKAHVGEQITVAHGKRNFKAEVVEQEPYGLIARHKIGGAGWCYHDTASGSQLEI